MERSISALGNSWTNKDQGLSFHKGGSDVVSVERRGVGSFTGARELVFVQSETSKSG